MRHFLLAFGMIAVFREPVKLVFEAGHNCYLHIVHETQKVNNWVCSKHSNHWYYIRQI
jgi:hypothetical protein